MKQQKERVTKTKKRAVQTKHSELEEYSRKEYPSKISGSPHNSESEYAKAIIMARGRVSHAARLLDVSHSAVIKRIKNSEFLQMVKETAIEERLDNAEEALDSLVEKENLGAIQFLLSTLGKDRGYVRREERSTTVQGGVVLIPGGMQMDNWTENAMEYRKKQEVERDKTMAHLLQKLEDQSSAHDSVYDAEFSVESDEDINHDLEETHLAMSDEDLLEEELPSDDDMGEWLKDLPDTTTPTKKRKIPKPDFKAPPNPIITNERNSADGFKTDLYEED